MTTPDTTPADDTRAAIVDGLRALADAIAADVRIPLPPSGRLQVGIVAATPLDVLRAADAGTGEVSEIGSLATVLPFGAVELEVFHVDDEAMALYHAKRSYAPNIAAGLVTA